MFCGGVPSHALALAVYAAILAMVARVRLQQDQLLEHRTPAAGSIKNAYSHRGAGPTFEARVIRSV